MIRSVLSALAAWAAEGQRTALATVVQVHGRAPLPEGTCLAVAADGRTAGAVSGGCVEVEVVRAALDVIAGAPARRLRFAPGGDELTGAALPCGGGIDVWVQAWEGGAGSSTDVGTEPLGGAARVPADGTSRTAAEQAAFAAAVSDERRASLPIRTLAWGSGDLEVFTLAVPAAPRLVLVGAGVVAGALCTQAQALGWRATVVDPRTAIAAHAPIASARELLLAWPQEALTRMEPLGPDDAFVALSHQPALDDAALLAALNGDSGFIGALGSRRSHADRIRRLRAAGCTERQLDRISGPVGLDLGASAPAEVAVSIVAEIIASRHGRPGRRLSGGEGRIQAPADAGRARGASDRDGAWSMGRAGLLGTAASASHASNGGAG